MNLKHRNYNNLHSKWLTDNRPHSRTFSNSSWDKQPHQYTGLYLSTELWQHLTNASSGGPGGLNSLNFLFLPLNCCFRCALSKPGPLGQSRSPSNPTKSYIGKPRRGWHRVRRGEGVRAARASTAAKAILVKLGPSSPKPWDLCSFSAHGQLWSLLKCQAGDFRVRFIHLPSPWCVGREWVQWRIVAWEYAAPR